MFTGVITVNERGNISLLAIVILAVVVIYISLTLHSAVSVKVSARDHEEFLVNSHNYRSAITRVISFLQEDILASGPFNYPDLEEDVSFKEISRKEEETIIEEWTDEEIVIPFEVLMDTTIYVDLNDGYGYLYDPDGNLILSENYGSWAIDSSGWGHGSYTLIMNGSVTVSYTQIVERIVEVDSYVIKVILSRNQNKIILQE